MLGLGPTQQTGFDIKAPHVEGDVFLELLDKIEPFRTRAHQTHIALEEIEALGDLIEMQSAQHDTCPGHARIPAADPYRSGGLFCIGDHGTKFEHGEQLAVFAHPLLPKQHRPP